MTPTSKLKTLLEGGDVVWETAKRLIHEGADTATASHRTGATILHRAAVEAPPDVLDWIASHGHPHVKCCRGLTPLMWAAANGNTDAVVRLSLLGGIFTQQRESPKSTALHLAATNGHLHCVQALVHHGAELTIGDQYGRTPLVCAILQRHSAVVTALTAALAVEREELYQQWVSEYILTLRDRITTSLLSASPLVLDLVRRERCQTTSQDDVSKLKSSLSNP